jgi:PAS domain-containing protein
MTSQVPVEMILLRQVASYLAIPILMMDHEGTLLFYNEPAERLLGISFDDAGPIRAGQLGGMFKATDLADKPLSDAQLPVVAALTKRQPFHQRLRFRGLDGDWHEVEATAIPVEGHGKRFLGVLTTFWETGG